MLSTKIKNKILLAIAAAILLCAPFLVEAINDVPLNGIVTFSLLTADTAVPTTILASSGGQVTSLDVQANYIDITLDNTSAITFNTTAPSLFIRISWQSGSAAYTVAPACPTTTATLTGTGAQVVLRLEVYTTNICPPPPSGGGGHTSIFPSNYSLTINNTSALTGTTAVILNLSAQDAKEFLVSNDPNFVGAIWQPFTNPTDLPWTLTVGDGVKTVYLLYKSQDGNLSPPLSASITLQTAAVVPPVIPPVLPLTPFSSGNFSANEALNSSLTISIDKGAVTAPGSAFCVAESLIKLPDDHNPLTQIDSTVYYCGVDGRRYVFPNPATYFSWYSSYDNIQIISAEAMAAIPLGLNNVTIRPGSRLVKFLTSPKVYAVAQGGALRWVVDEATAVALYGPDWSNWVIDVSDAFFVNYHISDNINLDQVTPGSVFPSANLLNFNPALNFTSY